MSSIFIQEQQREEESRAHEALRDNVCTKIHNLLNYLRGVLVKFDAER